MEACSGSHHIGRRLTELGHAVRLIPAQYVKGTMRTWRERARDFRYGRNSGHAPARLESPSLTHMYGPAGDRARQQARPHRMGSSPQRARLRARVSWPARTQGFSKADTVVRTPHAECSDSAADLLGYFGRAKPLVPYPLRNFSQHAAGEQLLAHVRTPPQFKDNDMKARTRTLGKPRTIRPRFRSGW